MRITFLGGADEIGASAAVLETVGRRILIDAGIRMNDRSGRPKHPDFSQLGYIDAVFLTHAHTDHSGSLPMVNKLTDPAPVFMTNGSFHLCTVLFRDALKLMSMFPEEYEIPLYDEADVQLLLKNIKMVPFNQAFMPVQDVQATFFPAGHILGAACLLFESKEGSVLFTGDFSATPQLTVAGALVKAAPDIVVAESTYGNRTHQPRKQVTYECLTMMKPILERGGKILIPAFAIGRSHEMILLLKDAMSRKIIPDVDIFVDGMINAVNSVYETQPSLLVSRLQKILRNKQSLFYTKKIQKAPVPRSRVLGFDGPGIIISSSGMLVGGPSTYYAQELLKYEKNALFLSGYQDEESPGRRLLELQVGDELVIDQVNVKVRAEIHKFSFSAHADNIQIREFVSSLNPKELVLTHGDRDARYALQEGWDIPVHLPALMDAVGFRRYHSVKGCFAEESNKEKKTATLDMYWESCFKGGVQQVLKKELEDSLGVTSEQIQLFDGFRPDYRDPHVYVVVSPEKRRHYQERMLRFKKLGDLRNQVVLYEIQNKCHLACCQEPLDEHLAWQAFSIKKGNAVTRIDPSVILHVFSGLILSDMSQDDVRSYLLKLRDKAKPLIKSYRRALLQGPEKLTLDEAKRIAGVADLAGEVALISALASIMVLQDDGCYHLRQKTEKVLTDESVESVESVNSDEKKSVDFNNVKLRIEQVLQSYPLKKTGLQGTEIVLHFDFPDAVDKDAVLKLVKNVVPDFMSVTVSSKINQEAFRTLLLPFINPSRGTKFSILLEKKRIILHNPFPFPDKKFKDSFLKRTGFILILS